tara:strand:- start:2013 stop:3314 length:1302 start_codon:yes stop_codon:yes gene_type:complete
MICSICGLKEGNLNCPSVYCDSCCTCHVKIDWKTLSPVQAWKKWIELDEAKLLTINDCTECSKLLEKYKKDLVNDDSQLPLSGDLTIHWFNDNLSDIEIARIKLSEGIYNEKSDNADTKSNTNTNTNVTNSSKETNNDTKENIKKPSRIPAGCYWCHKCQQICTYYELPPSNRYKYRTGDTVVCNKCYSIPQSVQTNNCTGNNISGGDNIDGRNFSRNLNDSYLSCTCGVRKGNRLCKTVSCHICCNGIRCSAHTRDCDAGCGNILDLNCDNKMCRFCCDNNCEGCKKADAKEKDDYQKDESFERPVSPETKYQDSSTITTTEVIARADYFENLNNSWNEELQAIESIKTSQFCNQIDYINYENSDVVTVESLDDSESSSSSIVVPDCPQCETDQGVAPFDAKGNYFCYICKYKWIPPWIIQEDDDGLPYIYT